MSTHTEGQKPIKQLYPRALASREVRPISNWHEWLQRWDAAQDAQWLESLLHVGYSITLEKREYGEPEYDEVDRHVFYLRVADGWTDKGLFKIPKGEDIEYRLGQDENGNVIKGSKRDLLQRLARKAFDMLCLNLFKTKLLVEGRRGKEFHYKWEQLITSEKLFPEIKQFFNVEREAYLDYAVIRNLSRRNEKSHNEQLAIEFLKNLVTFIWKCRDYERGGDIRKRLDHAKPWMIEILDYLEELDMLREWILELDDPCLEKLKEIALRNKLDYRSPLRENRLVASIDEACYIGSQAAWLIKEHTLMKKEHKRLIDIREAQERAAEAQEEIDRLSKK